ncbi:MAG: hypothetical protein ACLFRZ_12300 [Rhodosalinus sp.]
MKQRDLKPCALCGKGMAHSGQLHFYRVRVEQHVLDVRAIQRQHGLEQMLGPAAALGQVLGPDEDMAKGLGETTQLVCADCGLSSAALTTLLHPDDDASA